MRALKKSLSNCQFGSLIHRPNEKLVWSVNQAFNLGAPNLVQRGWKGAILLTEDREIAWFPCALNCMLIVARLPWNQHGKLSLVAGEGTFLRKDTFTSFPRMSIKTWTWHSEQNTFILLPMETFQKVILRLRVWKCDMQDGNLLTNVSTLRCRKANRNIKF